VWGLPPTTNGSPQHTQANHTTHSDGSMVRVLIGLCVRAVPLSRATAHHAPCADTDRPLCWHRRLTVWLRACSPCGAAPLRTTGGCLNVVLRADWHVVVCPSRVWPIRMTGALYTGALHGALLRRRDGFTRGLYTAL